MHPLKPISFFVHYNRNQHYEPQLNGMRMARFINQPFQLFYLSILVILINSISSCTQSHTTVPSSSANALAFKPPVIVPAGEPRIVNLDTCPAVQQIRIPVNDSSEMMIVTPNGQRQIKLVPPVVHNADFFIDMPKFANEQGLEAHSVFSSFQDKAGNMWMGTHGGGVTRFNGKAAVTFSAFKCNDIRAIIEDLDGNIWMGMGGCGLVKYDGRGMTTYSTAQGLIDNEVRALALDSSGKLWIACEWGVSCYDGKKFTNYNTESGLVHWGGRRLSQDARGNMWIATNGGVSYFDGKEFHSFTTKDGLVGDALRSFSNDNKGNMWIGTTTGISIYDGKSFRNLTTANGLPGNHVQALLSDRDGKEIWIGTYGKGVCRYDGNSFMTLSKSQGLTSDYIMTMTEDKRGNLWIGAEGGGATRYEGSAVTSYSTNEGLFYNYIVSIAEDHNGNLWFGPNNGGVCKYDGKTFTNYTWNQGFAQNRVNSIFPDREGNIWFCTDHGFSRYDGKSFKNYYASHGLRNQEVRFATQDSAGNLWIGIENGGINKFDGKTITNYGIEQGMPSNNVRSIIIDSSGIFWIATFGKGICRFDGKTFTNLDTTQGLTENNLLTMRKDSRGNLWIGSSNHGVSILRREVMDQLGKPNAQLPAAIFEKFTIQEGLANNVVYDIVEDKEQNIIIGTNFGLTVVRNGLQPGKAISNDQIEYYNQRTGYAIEDMNSQGMFVDSKGMIWGGTGHTLIKFDYKAVRRNKQPPLVTIQGIKIDNAEPGWNNLYFKQLKSASNPGYILSAIEIEENVTEGIIRTPAFRDSMFEKYNNVKFDSIARYFPVPMDLVLPNKHNNITIEFGAIEPAKYELVQYQYMLDGYDKDWSPPAAQAFATYGNINEGSYTFKVKAKSPDGVWSEPITYTFTVLAPWHRTWWAYTLYLTLFVLGFYALYRNRIKQLERKQAHQLQTVISTQEAERKRISRDLHDDVGTKLSALKLFLISLRNNVSKKQYGEVEELAANSEQLINQTVGDVREMLLNLSPGILDEFGFVTAVESLINKINQTKAIHFELSVFGMERPLKKEYQLALYRITQELINNVLKHAQAKKVSLQIGYRDENIIIMIEDDGKGFDVEQQRSGYGLKNLDARTKLLNGTLAIDSQQGKGTSVSIEIPYKFT